MTQESILEFLDRIVEAKKALNLKNSEDIYCFSLNGDYLLCEGVKKIASILGWPYITQRQKYHPDTNEVWFEYKGVKILDIERV